MAQEGSRLAFPLEKRLADRVKGHLEQRCHFSRTARRLRASGLATDREEQVPPGTSDRRHSGLRADIPIERCHRKRTSIQQERSGCCFRLEAGDGERHGSSPWLASAPTVEQTGWAASRRMEGTTAHCAARAAADASARPSARRRCARRSIPKSATRKSEADARWLWASFLRPQFGKAMFSLVPRQRPAQQRPDIEEDSAACRHDRNQIGDAYPRDRGDPMTPAIAMRCKYRAQDCAPDHQSPIQKQQCVDYSGIRRRRVGKEKPDDQQRGPQQEG